LFDDHVLAVCLVDGYKLTPDGPRFALFYTKLHDKVMLPLMTTDHPPTTYNKRPLPSITTSTRVAALAIPTSTRPEKSAPH